MTPELIQEMQYFAPEEQQLTAETVQQITIPGEICSVVLLKQSRTAAELDRPMDEIILELVYGDMLEPPGAPDSPAQLLLGGKELAAEGSVDQLESLQQLPGIWAPPNDFVKATCLRLFFPRLTHSMLVPEPEPTPEHLAVVFDCLRRNDIRALMQKYPEHVMRYGFFSSETPEEAQLVAKSFKKYEHEPNRTL